MQQHLSYHTLVHLAKALNERFAGGRLSECFSQQKDELTLVLKHNRKTGFLRCSCKGDFPYLFLQEDYRRAKTNSVNLFSETELQRIIRFDAEPYDRILYLFLENDWRLVFKMYGTRSNILLLENKILKNSFRTAIEEDEHFQLPDLDKTVPLFETEFYQHSAAASGKRNAIFPTLDRYMNQFIDRLISEGKSEWESLSQWKSEVEKGTFYVTNAKEDIGFWIIPPATETQIETYSDVIEALDRFVRLYFTQKQFYTEKRRIEQILITYLKKYKTQIASLERTLFKLETERDAEEIGHLLMGNLHLVPLHIDKVILEDWYTGGKVEIALDSALSPQMNAEKYYKKAKDDKKKKIHVQSQKAEAEKNLEPYLIAEAEFRPLNNLKQLRQFKNKYSNLFEGRLTAKSTRPLFREYLLDGYHIYVGKNAENNDRLTFGFAGKNDWWLHAKDVSGSHVVIRKRGNEQLPDFVLEYAAGIAAYYSKLRNNPLVTVSYTTRKYVRKHKKLAAGQVIVEREETLLIEPLNPNEG